VFDARLENVPPAFRAKLRHWREIVAEAHSEFTAKLPDAKLPPLARKAKWEEGRTEKSRYPNLMLPGVWERYSV